MVKKNGTISRKAIANKRKKFTEKTVLVFEQVIAESIWGIVDQFSQKEFDNKYFSELYRLQPLETLIRLRSIINVEIQKKEALTCTKDNCEE